MILEQLTVSLSNEPGELSKISDILGDEGINIKAITAAVQGGSACIHLVADDSKKAFEILTGRGYQVDKREVVAVETPDHPGGLNAVLRPLKSRDINVEFLYPAIGKLRKDAVLVVGAYPLEEAVKALRENYITILETELFAL